MDMDLFPGLIRLSVRYIFSRIIRAGDKLDKKPWISERFKCAVIHSLVPQE